MTLETIVFTVCAAAIALLVQSVRSKLDAIEADLRTLIEMRADHEARLTALERRCQLHHD